MSRAFVKELDDVLPETPPHRPVAPEMTPRGLAGLRARLAAATDERERQTLQARVDGAVAVPAPKNRRRVAFGAIVTVEGAGPAARDFRIVGEDEVDVAAGDIGAASPLAQALLGAKAGDVVRWERPAGPAKLTVRAVAYDQEP